MTKKSSRGENPGVVKLNGDIIYVTHYGFIDEATAQSMMDKTVKYAEQLRMQGKKSKVLYDMSHSTGQTSGARRVGKEFYKHPLDKVAVVVKSPAMRLIAQYIVRAGGVDSRTTIVKTLKQAEDWLNGASVQAIQSKKKRWFKPTLLIAPAMFTLIVGLTITTCIVTQNQIRKDSDLATTRELESTQDNLNERMTIYVNILSGFKAFFESNENVTRAQFFQYFDSLQLKEKYPGFSVFLYAKAVPAGELDQFVADARADDTFPSRSKPNYTVTGIDEMLEIYYPILYSAQGSSPRDVEGAELGGNPLYDRLFKEVAESGGLESTPTIDLNGGRLENPNIRPGFSVILPVYINPSVSGPENIDGFIAATFEHKLILDDLVQDDAGVAVRVYDNIDNTLLYEQDTAGLLKGEYETHTAISELGSRTWRTELYTPYNYGISEQEANIPESILVAGGIIALLVGFLGLATVRSRFRAMRLADIITEDLKRERNEAVTLREKDEAILSSIGDAVFAVNPKGELTLFNQVAEKLSGYRAEEALGHHYSKILTFITESSGKVQDGFITRALSGHVSAMKNHTLLVRKDGSTLAVADSAAPIRNTNGEIQGAIIVFRDVTKENELDRAKSEFVSLASHQLRTPLSAINWYGEMLLGGDAGKLSDTQATYVREIFEGNQRMIELVNSLLDVSRIEVGKLEARPEDVKVQDVVRDVEKELRMSVAAKQQAFTMKLVELPTLHADPKQLRMIIQNLMSNAVKYTGEKGNVDVVLRRSTQTDMATAKLHSTKPHFTFSVKDTGYGIPADQQSKIFTKLYRAENVQVLDVEGTGLGLYLVKELADKMGGRVWFDSVENQGTTFTVVLPIKDSRQGTK